VSPLNRKAGQRRLVDMSAAIEPDEDVVDGPPPAETEYQQTFPISAEASYVVRFVMDDHDRIKRWAVVQLRRVGGRWRRVAEYDSCNNKGVHVHFLNRDEVRFAQTHLRPVDSYADLVEGLDYAVDRVVEAWRENERRSDRGY
jgi:hypothetical protein